MDFRLSSEVRPCGQGSYSLYIVLLFVGALIVKYFRCIRRTFNPFARHRLTPQVAPAKLCLVMVLASLLVAAAAYLLGSIPTGYLLMRVFRHQDIRTIGSGNIGATNVMRSGAKGLGAATFLLDMLKGCAAVWLGAVLAGILAARLLPCAAWRPWLRFVLCWATCFRCGSGSRAAKAWLPGSECFLLLRRWPHSRLSPFSPCYSRLPLSCRWLPSWERPAFLSLHGSWFMGTSLPSSLPCKPLLHCSSLPSITRTFAACCLAPKAVSGRIQERGNPHEPHRHPRFRRVGNRHRTFAAPPRRPRRSLCGRTVSRKPSRLSTREKTSCSFPDFRFPAILHVTAEMAPLVER